MSSAMTIKGQSPGSSAPSGSETSEKLQLAVLPQWLADLIKKPRPNFDPNAKKVVGELDLPHNIEAAINYLVNRAPDAVADSGTGDTNLIAVAMGVLDYGLSIETALDAMLDHWNEAKASPPQPAELLKLKLENAWKSRHAPVGALGRPDPTTEFEPVDIVDHRKKPEKAAANFDWLNPRPLTEFDPDDLPAREWLVHSLVARTFVTALVSPGGMGKTQFICSLAAAIASGRGELIGMDVRESTKAWYWNQEDDQDELNRRFGAMMRYHKLPWSDLAPNGEQRLFLNSGVERPLVIAKKNGDTIVEHEMVERVIERIKREGIGLFIIDPLIEFHEAAENDNVAMRQVLSVARRIAVAGRCAVLVAAHTKKPPQAGSDGFAGDIDAWRGGSAQAGVVRLAYTMFNMSIKDAKAHGVKDTDRHRYVRLDSAKANLFLIDGKPRWFARESVSIGRDERESLGVLVPVTLERVGSDVDALCLIADTIAKGSGLVKGEYYALTDLMPAMSEAERTLFGSKPNHNRPIQKSLRDHGLVGSDDELLEVMTDAGKLKIQKKRNVSPRFMLQNA